MEPDIDEDGLFEIEGEGVPDDLAVEIVEEYHSWGGSNSYSDEYQDELEEYQEAVADAISEKDRIYDIQTNTSIKDSGAMHETWIFYAEEDEA